MDVRERERDRGSLLERMLKGIGLKGVHNKDYAVSDGNPARLGRNRGKNRRPNPEERMVSAISNLQYELGEINGEEFKMASIREAEAYVKLLGEDVRIDVKSIRILPMPSLGLPGIGKEEVRFVFAPGNQIGCYVPAYVNRNKAGGERNIELEPLSVDSFLAEGRHLGWMVEALRAWVDSKKKTDYNDRHGIH